MRVLLITVISRFVLFSLIFLASCSPANFLMKPGETQQQFKRDSYSCHRDSYQASAPNGDPTLTMFARNRMYEQCMDSFGYLKEPQQ